MIGVDETTVYTWERGINSPATAIIPKIIEFLGYVPFEYPNDTIGRLAWFKKTRGLSLKGLSEMMGRDPEQLHAWLNGEHKPFRKNLEKIEGFLTKNMPPP